MASPYPDSDTTKQEEESTIRSRIKKADVLKFLGLISFILLTTLVVIEAMPLFLEFGKPGGLERVVDEVQSAGPLGVATLFFMQLIQIIVALIPGEIIQVAAGMMFGPWLGAIIIISGCVVSSAFIYLVVSKLGKPFVQAMIPPKWMDKLHTFEETDRLNEMVFVLYLIPGLPKDVFTYIIPLTDMSLRSFVIISNIARLPGIVLSTYAANNLIMGDYWQSAVLFVACALIAVAAIAFSEKLIKGFRRRH